MSSPTTPASTPTPSTPTPTPPSPTLHPHPGGGSNQHSPPDANATASDVTNTIHNLSPSTPTPTPHPAGGPDHHSPPDATANEGPIEGGLEHVVVSSALTVAFAVGYGFILTGDQWEWLGIIALLHLLCAPATQKRYLFAKTSILVHFIGYITCVAFAGMVFVLHRYETSHAYGILSGLLLLVAIVVAEMLFQTFLEILRCNTGLCGEFRKQHGVLGAQTVGRFFYSFFVARAGAEGGDIGALVSTEASTSPPPYFRNTDHNLSNRLLAPLLPKVGMHPTATSELLV